MKTIILYSGGLDSTVLIAQALAKKDEVIALTIDYSQSNAVELHKAKALADNWGFRQEILKINLRCTNANGEVPARNTIFLSYALELALTVKADSVSYGANPNEFGVLDNSHDYISAMSKVFELHGVKLLTPIADIGTKIDVLRKALDLGVPLDLVHPCNTPVINGGCRSCRNYLSVLEELFPFIPPTKLLRIIYSARLSGDPYDLRMGEEFKSVFQLQYKEWGIKQALSRLPRPQLLQHSLQFNAGQSTYKKCALELGYTEDKTQGYNLLT